MEAQLQQSIPKKTHQEVVSKMQATIDGLNSEIERVKGEYQKTTALNETMAGLASQLTSQNDTIASLNRTITSQSQIIESQKSAIEALSSRLSQSTVPALLYDQTLARIEELQEKIRCMVDKVEYTSVQKKCDELTETLKSMVPREDYLTLQSQFTNFVPRESFEALQKTLSQYVPRDQLVASETRVHELEARLENYVPRSDYEELTARIALLAKEASTMSVVVPTVESPAPMEQPPTVEITTPQAAPVESTQVVEPIAAAVVQPEVQQEVAEMPSIPVTTEQPAPEAVVETPLTSVADIVPEVVEHITEQLSPTVETVAEPIAVETVPDPPQAEVAMESTPEVAIEARVETPSTTPNVAIDAPVVEPAAQSPPEQVIEVPPIQVATDTVAPVEIVEQAPSPEIIEIQSQLSEIKGAQDSGATTVEIKMVDPTMGFAFANTTFCARSGLEFLQDLEQTPIETIQNHVRSGDFERWFKDALSDDASAESLKSIRESNSTGEELRAKIVAVIAPRYKS